MRTCALLILTILIATSVLLANAFRDDKFAEYYISDYYACVAQKIIQTNDWLNLRDYYNKAFENDHPPLTFWATALSYKLFGETAFAAVFFQIFCTIGTCITVFFIGTLLWNDIAGFFSAIGLLLTRYVPRVAGYYTIDIPLMFFISLAVLFLLLAHMKNRIFYLPFGLSTALAVLTKGVVGLFPLGLCFLMIIVQRRFRDIWNPFFLGALLIFMAVPGTWFFLKGGSSLGGAGTVLAGYASFVQSVSKGIDHGDPNTRLRFLVKFFEYCWIIVPGAFLGMYFAVRDIIKNKRSEFLTIIFWILIFPVPFFISTWRASFYLLSVYPAMAVLFGIGIYQLISKRCNEMRVVCIVSVFFAGNIAAPVLFPHEEPKSMREVVLANTYFPNARKAVKALYDQVPSGMRLIAYKQPSRGEAVFLFSSNYDVEMCSTAEEFEGLVNSEEPVLFYVKKDTFSDVDKELHKKLKIVYAFDDQLLVTNQPDLAPVFAAAEKG